MENENFTIEDIETYCLGEMAPEQKFALEEFMQKDEDFAQEVQKYSRLFAGFMALQSESFAGQLTQWAAEWEEPDNLELIEWYLKDALGEKAKKTVEDRMKVDQSFAREVQRQQSLMTGFEAIRSIDFAQQMKRWEAQESAPAKIKSLSPLIRRIAIAASVLLVTAVGVAWYINSHFSNSALFATFYQSPNIGGTLGVQTTNDFQDEFATAHRSLQAADFPGAIASFKKIQSQLPNIDLDPLAKQYYSDNIEWSLLLAELGKGDTGAGFFNRLESIANNPEQEYQAQAAALLAKMKSIFY